MYQNNRPCELLFIQINLLSIKLSNNYRGLIPSPSIYYDINSVIIIPIVKHSGDFVVTLKTTHYVS